MAARRSTPRDERDALARHIESWSGFVFANILWAVLSIPLITLPAATAGLFAYMSGRARGQPTELLTTFFGAMRRLWPKATLLMTLNVLVGGLVVLNLWIFTRMDLDRELIGLASRSVTFFVAYVLLLVNLYAWSLLVAREDLPVGVLLKSALALAFTHPIWSTAVLVAAALPVLISLLLPRGIFVLGTISAVVLISTMGTWRVIRRHLAN